MATKKTGGHSPSPSGRGRGEGEIGRLYKGYSTENSEEPFSPLQPPLCYSFPVLPIARRELQIAARRSSTYWQRILVGGCALLLAIIFAVFFNLAPSQAGGAMFRVLSWAAFVVCLLDGVRCSADALSSERREGTLGLLFLTDLRGYDIVLGKFSSAAVNAFTTVIVTLLVFALPLLMGGVTAGESFRMMVTLVTAVLFSLSAGFLISALSTRTLLSLGGTLLLVLAILLVPFLLSAYAQWPVLWMAGPFGMFLSAGDRAFIADNSAFWWALLSSFVSSAVMLGAAGYLVNKPGSFEPKQVSNSWWKRLIEPKHGLRGAQVGSPESTPGIWLANRTLPGRRLLWWLAGVGALVCLLYGALAVRTGAFKLIFLQAACCFILKLWLAAVAPQSMHASRQSGALELLLCTPLKSHEIVRGQVKSLVRYLFPPALVVCIGFPIAAILGMVIQGKPPFAENTLGMMAFGLFWFLIFVLDFYAIIYVGLWFGLTSIRIEQAIAKTVVMVLFLPYVTSLVPCVGGFGFIIWPAVWIGWAYGKLFNRFSYEVTERPLAERGSSWWPFGN